MWKMQYLKCNGKVQCDKLNVTDAMWQMQCGECNLINAIWQMQYDKCNDINAMCKCYVKNAI